MTSQQTERLPEVPRDCRAAVFVGVGKPLELQTFPIPTPGPHEAVVRIECCTVCGSDLHTLRGERNEPLPSILGHEILGIVEQIGEPPLCDVDGHPLIPQSRVTWATIIACGHCERCRRGLPQKCFSLAKYGHAIAEGRTALSGGLAEYILLRQGSFVVPVPHDLSAKILCPVNCATATVMAAFRMAQDAHHRTVLILGAGMLGLTAAALAKTLGASHITLCDVNEERLQRAREFGADGGIVWVDNEAQLQARFQAANCPTAFDIVLELSGAAAAVETAFQRAAVGGKVILVGSVKKTRPVTIDPESVIRRCLSIHGVHNYIAEDLRKGVEFLLAQGTQFPFESLVSESFCLDDVQQAVAAAADQSAVRVAVQP